MDPLENNRHFPHRRVDVAHLRRRLDAVRRRMVDGLLSTPAAANTDSPESEARAAFFEQIARDALIELVAERARSDAYRDALHVLAAVR